MSWYNSQVSDTKQKFWTERIIGWIALIFLYNRIQNYALIVPTFKTVFKIKKNTRLESIIIVKSENVKVDPTEVGITLPSLVLRNKKGDAEIPKGSIMLQPGRLVNKKKRNRVFELVTLSGAFGRGIEPILEEQGSRKKKRQDIY